MAKVGRWVTDPKVGGYCKITRLKLLGFSSDRIFACNLDSREGEGQVHVAHGDSMNEG